MLNYSRPTGSRGDDVEGFRAEVQKNMERELKSAIDAHVKQQVMDAIVEAHPALEIPQSLISQENRRASQSDVSTIWRRWKSRYGLKEYSP